MNLTMLKAALAGLVLSVSSFANATLITFDDIISGVTSYSYDADGDLINDLTFSTIDPAGFNTLGPGPNQLFVNVPGIEGTTLLAQDLKVDFINGAVTSINFGFALTGGAGIDGVTFSLFDISDNMLDSTFQVADFTLPNGVDPSGFPEAHLNIGFGGLASYGVFDFSSSAATRYILDNFSGTFGSTENISIAIPEPSILAIFALGLMGLASRKFKKQ